MRLLMPSSETLIGATAKVIIFSTPVLRIGENGLIVMAIMIRNENRKNGSLGIKVIGLSYIVQVQGRTQFAPTLRFLGNRSKACAQK